MCDCGLDSLFRRLVQVLKSIHFDRELLENVCFTQRVSSTVADMLEECKRAESSMKAARNRLNGITRNSHAQETLTPEDALKSLAHPDPMMRINAISLCSDRWPRNPLVRHACEAQLLCDSNVRVQAVAAVSLGYCYQDTGDARIVQLLAGIVEDNANPVELIRSAYAGLVLVIPDVDLLSHDPPFENPDSFPIPEGINRELLKWQRNG